MEFSAKDLEFALEAIDKISAHKNRPNLPRIARYLYRIHDFSSHKTIKILEHLLAENRVKEVVYKGNISYRNALKWKWRRSSSGSETKVVTEMSCFVLKTLKVLINSNPSLAKTGVSDMQLERTMLITNPCLTVEEAKKLILTELEVETVQRNPDGLLVAANDADHSSAHNSSEEMSDGTETTDDTPPAPQEPVVVKKIPPAPSAPPKKPKGRSPPPQAVRKGDRIIRKRTRYDPSEFFCPPLVKRNKKNQESSLVSAKEEKTRPKKTVKKKRVVPRPRDAGAAAVRSGIQQSAPLQKSFIASKEVTVNEEKQSTADIVRGCFLCRKPADTLSTSVIPCVTCHRIGHDICIKRDEEVRPGTLKWMCVMCRSIRHSLCIICHTPDLKFGKRWSVTCDSCQSLYHNDCHKPHLVQPIPRIWVCSRCNTVDNLSMDCIETMVTLGNMVSLSEESLKIALERLCVPLPKTVTISSLRAGLQLALRSYPGKLKMPHSAFEDIKINPASLIGCGPDVNLSVGTSLSAGSLSATECLLSDPLAKPIHATAKVKERKDSLESTIEAKPKDLKKQEAKRPEPKAVVKLETDKIKESDKKDKIDNTSNKPIENANNKIIDKSDKQVAKSAKPVVKIEKPDKAPAEVGDQAHDVIDKAIVKIEKDSDNSDKENNNDSPRLYMPEDGIPDVTDWSVNDVYTYFRNRLGDTVGSAFLNQEIDGTGLRVMSREDVSDRLGLTLGAALKTLYIVRKIQRNTCDLVTLWAN